MKAIISYIYSSNIEVIGKSGVLLWLFNRALLAAIFGLGIGMIFNPLGDFAESILYTGTSYVSWQAIRDCAVDINTQMRTNGEKWIAWYGLKCSLLGIFVDRNIILTALFILSFFITEAHPITALSWFTTVLLAQFFLFFTGFILNQTNRELFSFFQICFRFGFFVTPILWLPDGSGSFKDIVSKLNPLSNIFLMNPYGSITENTNPILWLALLVLLAFCISIYNSRLFQRVVLEKILND